MPRGRPSKNPDVPRELVCSKCKSPKKTNPPQFRKQLEDSGLSKEQFIETYRCRSCRGNDTDAGSTGTTIKYQALPPMRDPNAEPTTTATTTASLVPTNLRGRPLDTTCHFPNIYLDNHKACDGCGRFEGAICNFHGKRLSKEANQTMKETQKLDA